MTDTEDPFWMDMHGVPDTRNPRAGAEPQGSVRGNLGPSGTRPNSGFDSRDGGQLGLTERAAQLVTAAHPMVTEEELTEIARSKMCGPHQECVPEHDCSCRDTGKAIAALLRERTVPVMDDKQRGGK